MVEVKGDLWKTPCNWICVPTNGIVKADGEAVMGKGVALQCLQQIWNAPMVLGEKIQKHGNNVHEIGRFTRDTYVPKVDRTKHYEMGIVTVEVYSFPTKHDYRNPADLELIEQSCEQIASRYRVRVMDNKIVPDTVARPLIPKVVLPRVGCGLGQLDWETQVKPICEKHFIGDDWIIVYQ